MDRQDILDRLQFYDDPVSDNHVDTVSAIEFDSLIRQRKIDLLNIGNFS